MAECRDVGLHLGLDTLQHASGELTILPFLSKLRHPKAECYADHDKNTLEQPMAKRATPFGHVRVQFHARTREHTTNPV